MDFPPCPVCVCSRCWKSLSTFAVTARTISSQNSEGTPPLSSKHQVRHSSYSAIKLTSPHRHPNVRIRSLMGVLLVKFTAALLILSMVQHCTRKSEIQRRWDTGFIWLSCQRHNLWHLGKHAKFLQLLLAGSGQVAFHGYIFHQKRCLSAWAGSPNNGWVLTRTILNTWSHYTTRKVAGSAKCKQSKTVFSHFVYLVCLGITDQSMKTFLFLLKYLPWNYVGHPYLI